MLLPFVNGFTQLNNNKADVVAMLLFLTLLVDIMLIFVWKTLISTLVANQKITYG